MHTILGVVKFEVHLTTLKIIHGWILSCVLYISGRGKTPMIVRDRSFEVYFQIHLFAYLIPWFYFPTLFLINFETRTLWLGDVFVALCPCYIVGLSYRSTWPHYNLLFRVGGFFCYILACIGGLADSSTLTMTISHFLFTMIYYRTYSFTG